MPKPRRGCAQVFPPPQLKLRSRRRQTSSCSVCSEDGDGLGRSSSGLARLPAPRRIAPKQRSASAATAAELMVGGARRPREGGESSGRRPRRTPPSSAGLLDGAGAFAGAALGVTPSSASSACAGAVSRAASAGDGIALRRGPLSWGAPSKEVAYQGFEEAPAAPWDMPYQSVVAYPNSCRLPSPPRVYHSDDFILERGQAQLLVDRGSDVSKWRSFGSPRELGASIIESGSATRVQHDAASVLRVCRIAGLDVKHDRLRLALLGQVVEVLQADPENDIVLCSGSGLGENVWFATEALTHVPSKATLGTDADRRRSVGRQKSGRMYFEPLAIVVASAEQSAESVAFASVHAPADSNSHVSHISCVPQGAQPDMVTAGTSQWESVGVGEQRSDFDATPEAHKVKARSHKHQAKQPSSLPVKASEGGDFQIEQSARSRPRRKKASCSDRDRTSLSGNSSTCCCCCGTESGASLMSACPLHDVGSPSGKCSSCCSSACCSVASKLSEQHVAIGKHEQELESLRKEVKDLRTLLLEFLVAKGTLSVARESADLCAAVEGVMKSPLGKRQDPMGSPTCCRGSPNGRSASPPTPPWRGIESSPERTSREFGLASLPVPALDSGLPDFSASHSSMPSQQRGSTAQQRHLSARQRRTEEHKQRKLQDDALYWNVVEREKRRFSEHGCDRNSGLLVLGQDQELQSRRSSREGSTSKRQFEPASRTSELSMEGGSSGGHGALRRQLEFGQALKLHNVTERRHSSDASSSGSRYWQLSLNGNDAIGEALILKHVQDHSRSAHGDLFDHRGAEQESPLLSSLQSSSTQEEEVASPQHKVKTRGESDDAETEEREDMMEDFVTANSLAPRKEVGQEEEHSVHERGSHLREVESASSESRASTDSYSEQSDQEA